MAHLQDGGYDATLNAAHHGLSRNGKPMIEFIWQINGPGGPAIKSFLHLTTRTGERNAKGIEMTRRWATDWDGTDPDWFRKNLETCRAYPIRLSIVNGPSYSDPSRIYSQVKWINRRDRWEGKRKSEKGKSEDGSDFEVAVTAVPDREIDSSRVASVPEDIAMTMKGVWSAFAYLTGDWTGPERERKWIRIVAEVGGGKLQMQFSEEDWKRVYERVVGRNTKNENENDDD